MLKQNSILSAARCCIASKWKGTSPPSEQELLNRISYVRRMDFLTALRNDTVDHFNSIWGNWDVTQEVISS
ncbi:hypothetical protein XELAEV_18025257mg [Xenopus laevis]|uniref:Uncharacterized protein n=1 Tax=Xenopus laevis TaxID=8355 RepID=A0A974HM68_XENLA|nr:hypothetical protein XELAEV_18025257mg [Xenopus laevis]